MNPKIRFFPSFFNPAVKIARLAKHWAVSTPDGIIHLREVPDRTPPPVRTMGWLARCPCCGEEVQVVGYSDGHVEIERWNDDIQF
jgi:hypothetical protein